jgi:hypothetical protein
MNSEDKCPRSITMSVVAALADAKGVAPEEMDLVLYDHVDTDALESLAEHGGSWRFTFEVPDHTITVTNDQVAVVHDTTETAQG